MKKLGLFVAFAFLLLVPGVFALNLQVSKADLGSVVISELNNPAKFELTISNLGPSDNGELYSYAGVSLGPKGAFGIPSGRSTLDVYVYPNSEVRKNEGYFNFEYGIKGSDTMPFSDTMTIKVVDLSNAIQVIPMSFLPGDKFVNITVKCVENTNLNDVQLRFKSEFFDQTQTISLGPYEQTSFMLPINSDNIRSLRAGQYIVTTSVALGNAKTKIESTINYLEKEGLAVKEETQGFLLRSTTITKTNEGNVPVKAKIEVSKDIITRLFTVSSLQPTTERNGFYIKYSWEKELKPAEEFIVTTTTNYTFPFILFIVVLIAAIMAKMYYQTTVTIRKRVSFVKTKGGQFAVRVTLNVSSKKSVSDLQVIDRMPGSTQLYEKFGTKPDKIDAMTRRLIWNIPRLNAGEERAFSYIIYSKLKIVGKFELPPATAIYNKDDVTHESFSNKTFFMSETLQRSED